MRRTTTLLGLAAVAVLAFTAIPAGTAAAEESKLLPEPTVGNPITDTMTQPAEGHYLSVSGLETKCKEAAGSESWTSATLGTWHLLLTECTSSLSSKCTGEGEPTGLIGASGTVHYWLALAMLKPSGSEDVSALVFLNNEVKFKCVNAAKTFEANVVVKPSCVAAEDLKASVNALVSKVHEVFLEFTSGQQSILSVLPPGSGSEIPCLLKLTVNGGAEQLGALFGLFFIEEYKQNGSALTIELMMK
jgi:hypothetical protein